MADDSTTGKGTRKGRGASQTPRKARAPADSVTETTAPPEQATAVAAPATGAQDDRHLPHPHGEAVRPAGALVTGDGTAGATSLTASAPTPEAPEDRDAPAGTAIFCPDEDGWSRDPAGEDGDGVGHVVLAGDDGVPCDGDAAAGVAPTAEDASGPAIRQQVSRSPAVENAAPRRGAAILPDGRRMAGDGAGSELREGYGLVFDR